MTNEELTLLLSKRNGAIIAPAGHGKTEMIADIVLASTGKQLLLTHTNAGVDALKKRLDKKQVKESKYTVSTIAAFCIRWCLAYKHTAVIPDFKGIENVDYDTLYKATEVIFHHGWAGKVLKNTYASIIVDEYQDCTIDQHSLIISLNSFLPVYVLGDPLQGIFDWSKPVVDWKTIEFEKVNVATEPWRWKETNPELGKYLERQREILWPALNGDAVQVQTIPVDNYIRVISSMQFDNDQYEIGKSYRSVLYITKWPRKQLSVCQRHPWRFQYDEPQELNELSTFAKCFDDENGYKRALAVLCFMGTCATKVTSELNSYINNLKKSRCDFSRIRKHTELKETLQTLCREQNLQAIMDVLHWARDYKKSRVYRIELFREMFRSIEYARTHGCSIYEGAQHIRTNPVFRRNYDNFSCLSSRTLLSKGLEFDCVLVDMTEPLRAKDFYVALTRARYEIIFITDSGRVILKP
jgi:DNA helicase-2/ATP-dependent DNA helicase PcrA